MRHTRSRSNVGSYVAQPLCSLLQTSTLRIMNLTDMPALILSALALVVSLLAALRQLQLAKHANTLPMLIDLFREHRGSRLTEARRFVSDDLQNYEMSYGLAGLPEYGRGLTQDLVRYYDNLGALVAHELVDLGPVAGYLGGSIIDMWNHVKPVVEAERSFRRASADPTRWQAYFENLYLLVRETQPGLFRSRLRRWRLTS
jgi:hypothetical protein